MNILALDTSGPSLSVAVLRDGALAFESTLHNGLTHSQNLMPQVESALAASGLSTDAVGLVAVVDGPGSFTGVRIGIAAAKGLARAKRIPCLGVDALEALAAGCAGWEGVLCPIRDARAGQVYAAAFRGRERLLPDAALKLGAYLEQVRTLGERALFLGDGVPAYRSMIADQLGAQAAFAPPHLLHLKAGAVAALALERPADARPGAELLPRYLRAPQAERLRLQKEGGHA